MPKVNVVSFVLVALASAPCYVTHLYIDFMTSGRECITSLIACYVYQFFCAVTNNLAKQVNQAQFNTISSCNSLTCDIFARK